MAFAEIVAILPDVLPHDPAVQMPPRSMTGNSAQLMGLRRHAVLDP
jgi:hypothetical protein